MTSACFGCAALLGNGGTYFLGNRDLGHVGLFGAEDREMGIPVLSSGPSEGKDPAKAGGGLCSGLGHGQLCSSVLCFEAGCYGVPGWH